MKIAIVYYSNHHGNTQKLLNALCREYADIVLINAAGSPSEKLSGYDLVGFASGIYFSKFHASVTDFAEKELLPGQKVFLLYTCGVKGRGYTDSIQSIAERKGASVLGSYGCRGYDTFGPWKLIGGIAKKHPNQADLDSAVQFLRTLLSKENADA